MVALFRVVSRHFAPHFPPYYLFSRFRFSISRIPPLTTAGKPYSSPFRLGLSPASFWDFSLPGRNFLWSCRLIPLLPLCFLLSASDSSRRSAIWVLWLLDNPLVSSLLSLPCFYSLSPQVYRVFVVLAILLLLSPSSPAAPLFC